MDDADITSTTCDDVDEQFDSDDENWDHNWNAVDVFADEVHPASVPYKDKESDVIVSEQARKIQVRRLWVWRTRRVRTAWLLLDHGALRVLENVCKHTCWWYELCRDEKREGRSRQRAWRQWKWSRQWGRQAWWRPRRSAEDRSLPSLSPPPSHKICRGSNGERHHASLHKSSQ